MNRTADPSPTFVGLRCPHCQYDLSGLSEARCPECGESFDPASLRKRAPWLVRRPNVLLVVVITLLSLYSPFAWVLDSRWERWWLIVPGFLPALFVYGPNDGVAFFVTMGVISVGLLVSFSFLGSRRVWLLMMSTAIALIWSSYSSWVAYVIYRA